MTPLYATPKWILVLLVPKADGRTDKIPIHHVTGAAIDAHDPANWTDHATAVQTAVAWGIQFTVGFVLTAADPFWCLDIDGALQPDGTWSPLSRELCAALMPCAVVEVSQSGTGLHIWGQGHVPPHAKKNVALGIELYTEKRFIAIGSQPAGDMSLPNPEITAVAARYFPPRAAGGELPESGPRADWRGPTDDSELLRRALASRSGAAAFSGKASFADLWTGDAEVLARSYPSTTDDYDRSSADAALCSHLAFWTGCDQQRIERIMRRDDCKLTRDKWERPDYLERTIGNACAGQRDVLVDRAVELPAPAPHSEAPGMTSFSGNRFLGPTDQAALFQGCVYVLDQHKALIPGGRLINPDRFRAHFGGYSFAMDASNERTTRNAWEAFTESQVLRAPRVHGTCFRPDLPEGTIVEDAGRTRVNTYSPVNVPRRAGPIEPFLRHLRVLFPVEEDRRIVLYYMAACVQHQGYKFQWAIVIQGVEGNGKTFLSRCVSEAIGRRYVHWPKASKLAKQFNSWLFGHTFFAVEDIHTSENVDVIEELKPMITGGDGLEIEAKGVDQISAEICGNFIFNTNHRAGLRKTRNDRRFAMLYCAQQEAEHIARDGIDMGELYDWARAGGYARVSEYLWTLPIPDEYNPATKCQRAPRTSATDEAIEASLGRAEQEVLEAIQQGLAGFQGGWISSMQLDRLLEDRGCSRQVPPGRRKEMLRTLGYELHPALPGGRVHNAVAPDGGKPRLFVQQGHPALALTCAAEVARAYSAAQGVR